MVSLTQLWLPIALASVLVFVASSVVHMVLKWHNADYRKLPDEDALRDALRKIAPAPGQYTVPHCSEMKDLQDPAMQQKFTDGPVALITVRPNGVPAMGKALGQWFALTLAVSFVTGCIAAHALAPGAAPLQVLWVTASTGFLAYATGAIQEGVWMGRPWGSVAKYLADALIYAFAGSAAFALLWPAGA
jgi:hypothetical protein